MATAQLSQRGNFLCCRGSLGAFDAHAVQSALQNLLTRPRPLVPQVNTLSRFDGACRSETRSRPFVDVQHITWPRGAIAIRPAKQETAFLREISEGTSH